MADAYNVVRSHHAALATLTEARLAADRATSRAEARAAEAAVAAAERVAAGARAAVVAALREGRVTSAANLLDLPNDCIDCIVALLSPKEAARASGACRALREAVARAGTPPAIGANSVYRPLVGNVDLPPDMAQELVERVRRCSPALGVRCVKFFQCTFNDASHAALLEAVLDAVPRAKRVDVDVGNGDRAAVDAVADVLLPRAGRGFDLGLARLELDDGAGPPLRRIAEGGIPILSLGFRLGDDWDLSAVTSTSDTLTSLALDSIPGVLPQLPWLPRLRRLKLITDEAYNLSTGQALTSVVPRLDEIVIVGTSSYALAPPLFRVGEQYAFWSSIAHSLTRLTLKPRCIANCIDWGGLQSLTALRELSIHAEGVAVAGDDDSGVRVDLPQLAPSVSRLIAGGAVRFRQPTASVLVGLRVHDQRQAASKVRRIIVDDLEEDVGHDNPEHQVTLPLVPLPAVATPRLSTLLLGYTGFVTIFDLASNASGPPCPHCGVSTCIRARWTQTPPLRLTCLLALWGARRACAARTPGCACFAACLTGKKTTTTTGLSFEEREERVFFFF